MQTKQQARGAPGFVTLFLLVVLALVVVVLFVLLRSANHSRAFSSATNDELRARMTAEQCISQGVAVARTFFDARAGGTFDYDLLLESPASGARYVIPGDVVYVPRSATDDFHRYSLLKPPAGEGGGACLLRFDDNRDDSVPGFVMTTSNNGVAEGPLPPNNGEDVPNRDRDGGIYITAIGLYPAIGTNEELYEKAHARVAMRQFFSATNAPQLYGNAKIIVGTGTRICGDGGLRGHHIDNGGCACGDVQAETLVRSSACAVADCSYGLTGLPDAETFPAACQPYGETVGSAPPELYAWGEGEQGPGTLLLDSKVLATNNNACRFYLRDDGDVFLWDSRAFTSVTCVGGDDAARDRFCGERFSGSTCARTGENAGMCAYPNGANDCANVRVSPNEMPRPVEAWTSSSQRPAAVAALPTPAGQSKCWRLVASLDEGADTPIGTGFAGGPAGELTVTSWNGGLGRLRPRDNQPVPNLDGVTRLSGLCGDGRPVSGGDTFQMTSAGQFKSVGWDNTWSRRMPTPSNIVLEADDLELSSSDKFDGMTFLVGRVVSPPTFLPSAPLRQGNVHVKASSGVPIFCGSGADCRPDVMEYDDPLPTTCTREIVGPAGDVMRRASSSAANAYWIYAVGACAIDPKLVSYGEIHCSVVDVKAPGSCMNGIVRGSREVTTDLPWPAACLNVNGTNECASPAVCFENSLTLMGDVRANGDLSVAAGMHVPAGNGGNDIARFYSEQNVCIAGPGRMMAQVASRSNDGVVHVGNNIFFGMLGEQGLGLALLRAAWADGSF